MPDLLDHKAQRSVASVTRRLHRREFLSRAAGAVAGGVATVVIGPGAVRTAFASSYTCNPPCGVFCSGCSAGGGCPGSMVDCTPSNSGCSGLCPYASAWWYTAGSVGNRHLCRDCRPFGPFLCACPSYGLCGCRSTTHY